MPKTSIEFRARLLALSLAAALLGTLPRPALANGRGGADGGEPGLFAAGHTSFVLEQATGRRVAVDVWYPSDRRDIGPSTPQAVYSMDPYFAGLPDTTSADWEARGYDRAYQESPPSKSGPFALVVYSSGFTFPTWANLFLGTRLASHGYVFAAIQHYGEGAWPWHPYEGIATISFNRPRDISFVLTELLAKNRRRDDLLHRLIEPRRLVAGGHSLGGYTALVLAGGDDTVCDAKVVIDWGDVLPGSACGSTPIDPRFSALVSLEGSNHFMRFEELERVAIPSLVMGALSRASRRSSTNGAPGSPVRTRRSADATHSGSTSRTPTTSPTRTTATESPCCTIGERSRRTTGTTTTGSTSAGRRCPSPRATA